MARKGEEPDVSTPIPEKPVSSDDLLKQAWESMGRLDTGERLGDSSTSRSAEMTSRANVSSVASTEQRESAEEIARMLAQETESRRTAERRPQPPPPQRQPTEKRRRRTQPLQAPPRQPQPQPSPPQQPRPTEAGGQPRQSRRGVAFLVFGLIWLASAVIGLFANDDSTTPDISIDIPDVSIDFSDLTSTTLDASIDADNVTFLSIRDLAPGTCVATLPLGEVIEDVATVPCSEPHQYELYANTDLVGSDYPGDDIFTQAFDACGTEFFDYVGETYATSDWYVDVITPTEEGWNKAADREVNCLLYLWNDDAEDISFVTGSAQGSGDGG